MILIGTTCQSSRLTTLSLFFFKSHLEQRITHFCRLHFCKRVCKRETSEKRFPSIKISVMNILHAVSKQQEVSPKLKKLQASCREDGPPAVQLEKDELRKHLTPMQYCVTQEKGTERCRHVCFCDGGGGGGDDE